MTISYVLAIQPIWYIVGLDGLAAGGAQLFTYDSLTRQPRATYQDIGGTEANTNPIIFNLNGTWGPIYWQIDSSDPTGYYIEAYDSAGNLLFEADNFPTNGGGGGSDVTTFLSFRNYITNNQFINHIPATASPIGSTNLVIAPSNHKGFTPAPATALALNGTYGVLGPDIRLVSTNSGAPTDQITFPVFALASSPMSAGGNSDMTPVLAVEYNCTGAGSGELYKNFQFPITQKVKNLSNQLMTFTVWAKVASVAKVINLYTRQYYGSGTGATVESTSTYVLQASYTLSTTWTKYITQFTMPDVSGNSLGTTNLQTDDDAVYIEIGMPTNDTCDILFTKPCLYLGLINPDIEFDSYDQIDSIDSTARTGDIKTSLLPTPPLGWLAMNDQTIGNTGSGATVAGSFTFQLYATIYTSVSDTWAPVSTGRSAPGTTMTNAIADFLAGKTLTLPRSLGRALAGAGSGSGLTARVLGEFEGNGSDTVTLTGANLPVGTPFAAAGIADATVILNIGGSAHIPTANTPFVSGSATPFTILDPTSYFNVFIKL